MALRKKINIFIGLLVLAVTVIFVFSFGLHNKEIYIQNFEDDEFSHGNPFLEPMSVVDGLAVYSVGNGDPVLLFPYPHGHTVEPMAQGPIAEILTEMGRMVITFDVPGAYESTRKPVGDIDEMIRCADEALERLGIQDPVDVIGHSMGGLTALAYAIERPERTQRLILVASMSGFPSAAKWGLPGSAFQIFDGDFWRIIIWGIKLNAGRGNLALHKQLQNLMDHVSFYDKAFFSPIDIDLDDFQKGVPIRTIWSKNIYNRLSFADRLDEIRVPTLIMAGRHDPEAPLPCSEELSNGIPGSSLVIFEKSGHSPFIEEKLLFSEILDDFLAHEAVRR